MAVIDNEGSAYNIYCTLVLLIRSGRTVSL